MKSILMPKLFNCGDDVESTKNKGAILYCDMLADCNYEGEPHKFVANVMNSFDRATSEKNEQSKKSLRGAVFEFVIGEVFLLKGIMPLYHQAELRHVPLAKFDWLLYHPRHPVSISCKTSSRERWKQAAYEGMALKQVYSHATNYLVSIERLANIEEKKNEAPRTIDHFLVAVEPEFDEALENISKEEYCEAQEVSPIIKSVLVK